MSTTYKPPCIVCGGEGCATSCASPRFVITTGGTYLGSTDVEAALRQLTIERDEARKERDKAAQVGARAMAGLAAKEVSIWETAYPTESYDQLRKRILKLTLPVDPANEGENP